MIEPTMHIYSRTRTHWLATVYVRADLQRACMQHIQLNGSNNFGCRQCSRRTCQQDASIWSMLISNMWGHVRTNTNGLYVCASIQNSSVSPIHYIHINCTYSCITHESRGTQSELSRCEVGQERIYRQAYARYHLELQQCRYIYSFLSPIYYLLLHPSENNVQHLISLFVIF